MKSITSSTRKVPAGGAATINGVLYQMLWSLLQAARLRFVDVNVDDNEVIQEATIVLEPCGGGGDLVVKGPPSRRVEQIKARPDGGTWSLREIVEKVVPDLYLARDADVSDVSYRFITEGVIGDWQDVYKFFCSLGDRTHSENDPLSDLDDQVELKFGRKKEKRKDKTTPFWDAACYNEKTLFLKVVEQVRSRKRVRNTESEKETQKQLRSVLGNFEFVGSQFMSDVEQEINSHLMAIVDRNSDLDQIRNSLAMELAAHSTAGGAEIDCQEFFSSQGLNAIPLTDWIALRSAATDVENTTLRMLGYSAELDVRRKSASRFRLNWPTTAPMVAITGESGSGKSWRCFAACQLGRTCNSLSVVIRAGPTSGDTLTRASSEVWQRIAGHDEQVPLGQIADRVNRVLGNRCFPWLTLFVDGSIDLSQSRDLLLQPWETWGIRIAVTVSPAIAISLEREGQGRCLVEPVDNFSDAELHHYLELFLGDEWPEIPEFVRNPLRIPLLASLYRQVATSRDELEWNPNSEYEVFSEFWGQLDVQPPGDRQLLVRLAENFLVDGQYPFPLSVANALGGDDATIHRLERAGWLRVLPTRTGASLEFPHLRLLNWSCAVALVSRLELDKVQAEELAKKLRTYLDGESTLHGNRLGFVPMDFLWLVCQDQQLRQSIPVILQELEKHYPSNTRLYKELLPTLGCSIVNGLSKRLRTSINDSHIARLIADSIAKVRGGAATQVGLALLKDENRLLQVASLPIIESCPSGDALDRLWQLHMDTQRHPENYVREQERPHSHLLYERTFAALQACCREFPEWLDKKLGDVDGASEPIAVLGYLLVGIDRKSGQAIWHRHKKKMFDQVPANKQRCLATCIGAFNDLDEIPWLVSQISESEDLVGAAALKTLARISLDDAVDALERLPLRELAFARGWFADHLFAVAPNATAEKLRTIMKKTEDRTNVAIVFEGRLPYLDTETLDMILEDVNRQLSDVLTESDVNGFEKLYRPMQLLSQINQKRLVDHLSTYQDSELEEQLVDLVLQIGPRKGGWTDSLVREEAIEFLYRIGGDGFLKAVNSLLRADSRFGRLDGIGFARRRQDSETIDLLTDITEQQETWEGAHVEQCHAGEILAEKGVWPPVLALLHKLGMRVLMDITDLSPESPRPPAELLVEVADQLSNYPGEATAGAVIVLGYGDATHADIVRQVANVVDPNSEVAHACAVAFEMLRDSNELSVPFLRQQLNDTKKNFSATNALIVNGTQASLEALEEFAGDRLSGAIAVNLCTRLNDSSAAIRKTRETIVETIRSGRTFGYSSEIFLIVGRIHDEPVCDEILSDPIIEEFLRREAFGDEGSAWATGSKAHAILCLAMIDSHAAVLATQAAMRNVEGHDRDYYPPILAKLMGNAAVEPLLQYLEVERSDAVRKSIGRSLYSLDAERSILTRIASQDHHVRQHACSAAGWAKDSHLLKEALLDRVGDAEEFVSHSAAEALLQIRIREESRLLCEAIKGEQSEDHTWLYLDCLIAMSDPGDIHRSWPIEASEIWDKLSLNQDRYAFKRLKKRREKENK